MNRVVYALVALGFVMLGPQQVHAGIVVSLPTAETGAGCVNDLATPSSTEGATSCTIAGAAAQLSLDPAVQLTATSQSSGPDNVDADAGVVYFFELVGPPATLVPIIIDTSLASAVSGYAGSSASISVNTVPSNLVSPAYNATVTACQNNAVPTACIGDPAVFDGAIHLTAISNMQGQIDLHILTGAAFGGFASASADPLIMIDPSFSGAGDFSLVLSDGVGNGLPTVPEPPTWTMMVIGLGLSGLLLTRPRRTR